MRLILPENNMGFVNRSFVACLVISIIIGSDALAQTRGAAASRTSTPSAPPGIHSVYGTAAESPAVGPATVAPVSQLPPYAQGKPVALGSGSSADMLLGSGDLLEISVYGAPDFDKKMLRVSGSGDIVLPLIGAQHVAGLTVAQTEDLIARKLAEGKYFTTPQVDVLVIEFTSQGVSVLGEVQRPGVYPVLGEAHLFDVLSVAGGVTARAGKIVTITHRSNPAVPEIVTLGSEVNGSTEGNVSVHPGDTVKVSKAGVVYVVGDVHMPGGFVIENGKMTVLQAVALAQGTLGTAKLDSAKLIRNSDGAHEEIPIPLKKILVSKADDMPLQPEDIVFVPGSIGKSAAHRGLEAVVQMATGLAIYGPRGY